MHAARMRSVRSQLIASAVVVLSTLATGVASAAELVHADGRRETVTDLRQTSGGRWTYALDGRRIAVTPGEVAVVVDDDGAHTETIPDLSDTPLSRPAEIALQQVADKRNQEWMAALDLLSRNHCRVVHDALVALAADRDKRLRARAVTALVALRTKESVRAAAAAVVAEKDRGARRDGASALFAGREILIRADAEEQLAAGMADKDTDVSVTFALLAAPLGEEQALEILRGKGVTHSDHHFREAAALALARAGDDTGEQILAGMLTRSRVPGFDADQKELMTRTLVREQVEICNLFAGLGGDAAEKALRKAARSPHDTVKATAEAALERRAEAAGDEPDSE